LTTHTAACAAFPGSIPPEILYTDYDHRRPWIDPQTGEPGDRGAPLRGSITFTPRSGVTATALDQLYRHLDRPIDELLRADLVGDGG
jgi:hypothetical protein